jgi:2-methylisocitrate lyase-like PEP mutase family enzyme
MSPIDEFRVLHGGEDVLLMPNAWDVGSARILQHLGFRAVATTSGGAAAARGVADGQLGAEAVLAHCAELAAALDVPVSADLENGFADDPGGVAATIHRARDTALAGASVEDWSGTAFYDRTHAAERVAAAVDAADGKLLITARAESFFRGAGDLEDTVARLRSYAQAGADVVFAPGIHTAEQIRTVVTEVDVPVSVLAVPGTPPVAELAELGVRRVSVGGSFAFHAYAALADVATELRDRGTYGYTESAGRGRSVARDAFASVPGRPPVS